MPLYPYECKPDGCGHRVEVLQRYEDPPPECPNCGRPKMVRLLGVPAIAFVGPGFYVNDYGKGSRPDR